MPVELDFSHIAAQGGDTLTKRLLAAGHAANLPPVALAALERRTAHVFLRGTGVARRREVLAAGLRESGYGWTDDAQTRSNTMLIGIAFLAMAAGTAYALKSAPQTPQAAPIVQPAPPPLVPKPPVTFIMKPPPTSDHSRSVQIVKRGENSRKPLLNRDLPTGERSK